MTNETLKPCPFCGGTPKSYEDTVDAVGEIAINGGHYIGTCSTRCRVSFTNYFPTKQDAIKAWNTRNTKAEKLLHAIMDGKVMLVPCEPSEMMKLVGEDGMKHTQVHIDYKVLVYKAMTQAVDVEKLINEVTK